MSRNRFQSPSRTFCAAAMCLVSALAGLRLPLWNGAPPEAVAQDVPQARIFPSNRVAASAGELRKRYPMISLRERLAYESADRENAAPRPDVRLTDNSRKRLNELEQHYGRKMHGTVRAESLSLLHSNQVETFMRSEGFGMSRMVSLKPSPEHLEYPQPEAIPVLAGSADDLFEKPVAGVTLPEAQILEEGGGAWMPSRTILNSFHTQDQQSFAAPWSLGYVKDRDHVAGFVPHGFLYVPELIHPDNKLLLADPATGRSERETRPERWKIGRLELVSLLQHDQPAVYVSDTLLRMKDLDKTTTRPLTGFELQALQALVDGEDLVTVAEVNDINMLGAVRAVEQCTACHDARRGELLGAFSYRLKRDPPLKVPAPRTKPAAESEYGRINGSLHPMQISPTCQRGGYVHRGCPCRRSGN
jgi:hypothetical protein